MRMPPATHRRFWGAVAAVSGVLYLWLAVPVKTHGVLSWEPRVAEVIAAWQQPWLDSLLGATTWTGRVTVLVPATIAVAFLNRRGWGDRAWLSVFAVAAAPLVCEVLGWWVARPHPSSVGDGFPSAHAFVATTALGLAAAVLWAVAPSRLARSGIGLAGGVLVLAVAVGRVYLGLNWPADAVGGVLGGTAYLGGGMWLLHRLRLASSRGGSP